MIFILEAGLFGGKKPPPVTPPKPMPDETAPDTIARSAQRYARKRKGGGRADTIFGDEYSRETAGGQ